MNKIKVSDDTVHYNATSLHELQTIVRNYLSEEGVGGWIFRGQADQSWPLVPKAGRSEYDLTHGSDLAMFSLWRKKAIAYERLPDNDLDCLAIAQHHGLATRLLDWSDNPLVAIYFACMEQLEKDGAVYLFFPRNVIEEQRLDDVAVNEITQYIPSGVAARIVRQSGRFTYHPNPSEPLEFGEIGEPFIGQRLKKIIVAGSVKREIINELNLYNINEEGIFPDLDGLSRHFNWLSIRKDI